MKLWVFICMAPEMKPAKIKKEKDHEERLVIIKCVCFYVICGL